MFRPVVIICIPTGVTEVEKRAVLDATSQAARESYLVEEPMAAAIGLVSLWKSPPAAW